MIIPVNLRPKILEELHLAHAGMSRMKMVARNGQRDRKHGEEL